MPEIRRIMGGVDGEDRRRRPADQGSPSATSEDWADYLIPALRAGEPEAYQQLHALMADRLFRGAFRLLEDRQEAEDVVQEAFVELIAAGCPPSKGRSLEAWLYTSVRFTCADQTRRQNRRPTTPRAELPEHDVEDEYWLGFDPALERALAELTPQQRLIIQLKHIDGLDGHEIADIIGSNRVAVYAAAARAERRLNRLLSRLPANGVSGSSS